MHRTFYFTLAWLNVRFIVLTLALLLGACSSAPKRTASSVPPPAKSGGYYLDDGPGEKSHVDIARIPDAVPRSEPLHSGANWPYTVLGRTYTPIISAQPFRQSGLASWYGRKYHGQKTATGEIYDMYAMTAAHTTLPLPSYARVTNPANGKSVVVRINDRGPFHPERIIDLSYAAAYKLDIAQRGSGTVSIERVFPGDSGHSPPVKMPVSIAPTTAPAVTIKPNSEVPPVSVVTGEFFLQLGAFGAQENAEIFRARLVRELEWNREPIQIIQRDNLFRVRMGPYPSRAEAEAIAAQVKQSRDFVPIIQKP